MKPVLRLLSRHLPNLTLLTEKVLKHLGASSTHKLQRNFGLGSDLQLTSVISLLS